MSLRSAVGNLLVGRPGQQSLFGYLVRQAQQVQMAFGQHRPGALVAPVLGGPFSHLSALFFRDRVEPILARFTAGQYIAGVELAGGATAVGFSALAAQKIKGPLNHWFGTLEAAQGGGQGCVGAPELLAKPGKVGAQSVSIIYQEIQIDKRKVAKNEKSGCRVPGCGNGRVLRSFRGPSPTV